METTHGMVSLLERLCLLGILQAVDVGNQQAMDRAWTSIEALGRLLEDEVEGRAQR